MRLEYYEAGTFQEQEEGKISVTEEYPEKQEDNRKYQSHKGSKKNSIQWKKEKSKQDKY